MHSGVQNLTFYHFGGDEAPNTAWIGSPACQKFNLSRHQLMEMFVTRVAQIAQAESLSVGGWEDSLMNAQGWPILRSSVQNDEVVGYSWNNVWEWGGGNGAYRLANANYKVSFYAIN